MIGKERFVISGRSEKISKKLIFGHFSIAQAALTPGFNLSPGHQLI